MTLKERRVAAGLLQKDVAKRLNVTKQAVGNWELGKNGILKKYHKPLAKLYHCTVGELLGDGKEE